MASPVQLSSHRLRRAGVRHRDPTLHETSSDDVQDSGDDGNHADCQQGLPTDRAAQAGDDDRDHTDSDQEPTSDAGHLQAEHTQRCRCDQHRHGTDRADLVLQEPPCRLINGGSDTYDHHHGRESRQDPRRPPGSEQSQQDQEKRWNRP